MMQLSVLVPVYRHHPATLLSQLQAQLEGQAAEVLLFDDSASPEAYHWHALYAENRQIQILTANQNLGRAAVRNRLMEAAKGDFLLFLDGDMELPADFIRRYQHAADANKALCGGLTSKTATQTGLRAAYSRTVEEKSPADRQKHPYRAFTAANLWLPARYKSQLRFPQQHRGYGHEDTHFGLQMLDLGLPIEHLHNPAIHTGFDSDEVFVEKTKEAVKNLVRMYVQEPLFLKYEHEIKLIKVWHWCQILGINFVLRLCKPWLESALKNGRAGLKSLSIYKIACFDFYYRRKASL